MTSKYVATIGGIIIANFAYQFITTQDYYTALERSYFQAGALFAFWLVNKL